MAGTLTISTLSDGTYSTSSTNLTRAPCVAWVNFNGQSSAAIRASYNVSSVTYNSTGIYTVNFTSALADANYAAVLGGSSSNSSNQGASLTVKYDTAPTTTACALYASTYNSSVGNPLYCNAAFFR